MKETKKYCKIKAFFQYTVDFHCLIGIRDDRSLLFWRRVGQQELL